MQDGTIFELDGVEKDLKEDKDAGALSRILLFLPKLILITLIVCLILFLADLVYYLVQDYLTSEISFVLPEISKVINFARGSTGFLAMGIVLAVVLFVFARFISIEKKNEIFNDEQGNEPEASKMLQAMIEIEESETPEQVVPLPVKKKASRKIYGKYCVREEAKTDENFRKKNKPECKYKGYYPGYNSGQRGNIVIFKHSNPAFQRRANRSITPVVDAAANRIRRKTKTQGGNETL